MFISTFLLIPWPERRETSVVDTLEPLLSALKAVAEKTRLRLLALCAGADLTVSELVRILAQSQPRVSRHLKLLAEAGLLDRFREGSLVFHRIAEAGPGGAMARRMLEMLPVDDPVLALDQARLAEVKDARAEAAAAYFRRNAANWDKVRALYVDEIEVEGVFEAVLPENGAGDLLDVGTGTGRMLEVLGERFERAHGVDMSHEMLAAARVNIERAGLANCAVRNGDMYQLPFPAESFDVVTIHQVLHFAERPARAIAEAARVLRPGGRVVVADFAPHDLEFLRHEHEHRRLGFGDGEVGAWFEGADLESGPVVHLPGDPLTVTVWLADKPEAPDR
jgi:SAM-dependent methyltransferase